MEYIENHNLVEYSDISKDIFSGGINAKNMINNSYTMSLIKANEDFDRFKDLYVPVGLQQSKYNYNKYTSNVNGGFYNKDKYDYFLNAVKGKVKNNYLNKTRKKKIKK